MTCYGDWHAKRSVQRNTTENDMTSCCKDKPKHDFTKPGYYRTRDGGKAYVVGVAPKEIRTLNDQPVLGYIIGELSDGRQCWSLDGWWNYNTHTGPNDLIEPWREPVVIEGWVNVFDTTTVAVYWKDRETALESANLRDHIDCRKIRYIQGKGIIYVTEEG